MNDEADLPVDLASPRRPSASELVERDDALLMRTDLMRLGLPRRAVDEVFATLPVVVLPGFSRPFVKAEDFRALVERSTYSQTEVRPTRRRRATSSVA